MSKQKQETTPPSVVINEHGVITAGFQKINVPTGVKGITVNINVAQHDGLWYAGYHFDRTGTQEGNCGSSGPVCCDVDNSHETRSAALDAILEQACNWMRSNIDSHPKGAWAGMFKKALKAVEEYRFQLRISTPLKPGQKSAGNWTCPDCGLLVSAQFAECACGTTNDDPVEQESGEVLEGEILPPEEEPTALTVLPPAGALSGLDKITAIIHDDLDEINQLEEQAVNRAIRVGIMQEMAKRLLPHGEFTAWREREFDKSIRTLKYYHLLALKRLAEVGLLQGHDKATPMQIPLPRDLAGLTTDTLIPEKYSQQVFDWGDNAPASINEALARYGVKKLDYKRRGGDHGGGAASHERSMNRHQIELELAIDEWRLIIKQFRDFAIARNRSQLVPGPMLEEGMKSIKDCMRQVEQVIQKG